MIDEIYTKLSNKGWCFTTTHEYINGIYRFDASSSDYSHLVGITASTIDILEKRIIEWFENELA